MIQHISMKNGGKYSINEQSGFILPKGNLNLNAPAARDAMKTYLETLVKEADGPYSPAVVERMNTAETDAIQAERLCKLLVAAVNRAYVQQLRCETRRRGTRLVYELLVYQDKNKKWPEKLGDLPLEALKAVKIDPFSGNPFVYRLEEGKPLLYSVANDGTDDGGKKHDKKWGDDVDDADYIFWPRQKD